MLQEIGKLYVSSHTEARNNIDNIFDCVVLCTGKGKSEKTFAGVVVKQTDEFSDHRFGDYSETWTSGVFSEYEGLVNINNKNWKPQIKIGDCNNG